jgi:hypothetical protein
MTNKNDTPEKYFNTVPENKCNAELEFHTGLVVCCDLEKGHSGSHLSAEKITNEDVELQVNVLWQKI